VRGTSGALAGGVGLARGRMFVSKKEGVSSPWPGVCHRLSVSVTVCVLCVCDSESLPVRERIVFSLTEFSPLAGAPSPSHGPSTYTPASSSPSNSTT
jgi:hypothetical protein